MLGAPAPDCKKVTPDLPALWARPAPPVYPAGAMNNGTGQPWAIEVLSVGAASAGAVAWRLSGRLHVSAIVKATFSFAPGAAMTHVLPVPVRAAEVRHPDRPEGSIREPLDTAPELALADVTFVGHACTPALVPAPRLAVRLALRSRTGALLLNKSLEVLGDRVLIPGKPPPEPAPFTRVPMVYERAYGGPDYDTNPVGVGQFAELAGRRWLPNIVHPDNPPRTPVEPAGFGPISIRWPQRRRLLGVIPTHMLERPIAEIPGELDKSYFQSAPIDQRTRALDGDEWIVLEGLHSAGTIETQLPSPRGVARVYLPNGSSQSIALVADTLLIDGDAEQCSIIWRGSFPIPSVADLPMTAVAAGVELPGRPAPLPDRFPRAAAPVGFGPLPPAPVGFGPPPPAPAGRRATVALGPPPPFPGGPPLPLPPLPAVPPPLPLPAAPFPGAPPPPFPGAPPPSLSLARLRPPSQARRRPLLLARLRPLFLRLPRRKTADATMAIDPAMFLRRTATEEILTTACRGHSGRFFACGPSATYPSRATCRSLKDPPLGLSARPSPHISC